MAIGTFSELQTAVTDRLARTDFSASQTQECIALAEAEMQRSLRTLDMETRTAVLSITAECAPVPADFLQVRSFYLNSTPRKSLEFLPDDAMTDMFSATGMPKYYNVSGGKFRFGPRPNGSFTATLIYYAKIPSLTSVATTNWMLTAHPDAYLFGALKHAAVRLQDTQSAMSYDAAFRAALDSIQQHNNRNRWAGPGMAVRVG